MGVVKRRGVRENRRKGFEQKLFFIMYSCHKHFLSTYCVLDTGYAVVSKMGIAFELPGVDVSEEANEQVREDIMSGGNRALENIEGIRWVRELVWGKGGP